MCKGFVLYEGLEDGHTHYSGADPVLILTGAQTENGHRTP